MLADAMGQLQRLVEASLTQSIRVQGDGDQLLGSRMTWRRERQSLCKQPAEQFDAVVIGAVFDALDKPVHRELVTQRSVGISKGGRVLDAVAAAQEWLGHDAGVFGQGIDKKLRQGLSALLAVVVKPG